MNLIGYWRITPKILALTCIKKRAALFVSLSQPIHQVYNFNDKNFNFNYLQKYYKSKYGFDAPKLFPNAYRAYSKGIVLPLYEKLNTENILYISKKVNELC